MPKIKINGAELWYDIQGDGEPVFCIGGMILVSSQYDFVTPILSKSCKVINYDLRGVNKSAPVPSLNYRDFSEQAEDVRGILDAVGLEKVHIWAGACAHIGVRFAARYPDRTASLIFFPWFRQIPLQIAFFDRGIELCNEYGTMERFGETFVSSWKDRVPRLADWALPKFMNNMSCEAFKIHWNSMKNCDLTDEILKIKVPTLMLMGTEDTGSPKHLQEDIKYVVDSIPGVETKFIEGSGRTYYMMDNPAKTSEVVINWLKKHPIRSSK